MKTKIEFRGFSKDSAFNNGDKAWPHFKWDITVNSETFEYSTGIGNGVPKFGKGQGIAQNIWERGKKNKKPDNSVDAGDYWAVVPNIDEVLGCLFSDARAGSESFDNFCDDLGYSNDSLKALDTYRACMENTKKLRKALGAEYETERARIEAMEL